MSPTPYPEVNTLLQELLDGIVPILGKHLLGMYLFGSLALGDFDEASDIDVAIVTDEPVTDEQFLALKKMHAQIARGPSPLAIQIEASYLSLAQLRRYDPTNAMHPQLQRDAGAELEMQNHARVVERHVLRERGIVIFGPALRDLIEPVTADDLRESAREVLKDWLLPLLNAAEPFDTRGYQSYTVLSLTRILYTLHFGTVASKPAAARWAQQTLDPEWKPLIERALVGRHNSQLAPEAADVQQTLEFARFVLSQAGVNHAA